MNSNRLTLLGLLIAVILIGVYASIFVVNERQQAIVLRFGEIRDVKTEPGLYFKAPFAFAGFDNVQIIEDRLLRLDLSDQPPVQVSGGRFYEVDAFLTFKITDARRFRETVSGDLTSAAARLRTRFDAALRRIEDGEYGYCIVTGEPISLKRLDARPIATMSLEAQERHERREKVHRDD